MKVSSRALQSLMLLVRMAVEGYGVAWLPQSALIDELERGYWYKLAASNGALSWRSVHTAYC